jgi:hypothetical protein
LKRVLCRDLVEEVLALRSLNSPMQPSFIPPSELPLTAVAAAGD